MYRNPYGAVLWFQTLQRYNILLLKCNKQEKQKWSNRFDQKALIATVVENDRKNETQTKRATKHQLNTDNENRKRNHNRNMFHFQETTYFNWILVLLHECVTCHTKYEGILGSNIFDDNMPFI